MISINDLTYEIGSRALFKDANWHIKPGDKAGLIGANGTGKTTLLKLIVREYTPSGGSISNARDLKIGYLNQDMLSLMPDESILHVAMEAFERQNQLHHEIASLLKKIETDHSEATLQKLADKQHEFGLLDGYSLQYKAEEILEGLGFASKDLDRPLKEFSGGWRMRVMLAKILLQQPDLLLLDEPTNHLDLPSIKWLEKYLGAFPGAFIIVSHDRYFLDRTVQKIVEAKNGRLTEYAGNYSFYLEEKALREEIQRNRFRNQQQQIKEEQKLIDRFRAKASKAKMVQSRIKALERIDRVEDVEGDVASLSFRFSFSKSSGKTVVEAENISKSYPGITLLENTSASILKGQKIALIGANGKGKSTLLRIVAGVEPCEGTVRQGHNVVPAFFAQHQLESLDLEKSILDELLYFAPQKTEKEIRSLLGCFLFSGDDVFKKIRVLSGGEKSRVALAKTLTSDANFLLLDEPTNHLDMQSVNVLVQALQQYEGTFILVSHDRYLVQEVANTIWFIEDGEIKEYPGTYEEYEYWSEHIREKAAPQDASSAAGKNGKAASAERRKGGKKPEAEAASAGGPAEGAAPASDVRQKNGELKKLGRSLEELEQAIEEKEEAVKQAEEELTREAIYQDPAKLEQANREYARRREELEKLNEQWNSLAERITELETE
ncbi:ATP-binding cassette subfamily F protein 3 [Anseongella ginsenosidimutans]|uniref:ATP-binding cassette subfamily F protein 3 n=1 Tax=Anseongella ginsenosidimutans TaxID=496056 RepID=A0A4R3KR62_9SPHI|nr:ABC-F family ATP-binding cassette domain-containing protein [Anseongella ginsenosidimutans]QEC52838.1 ATP-binding cassette domain-containing protein [Anseongella ginsenosidimutans]TCS87221.1 ATP-binding cassette subfamily F protein 3 [Anseongella ginsenosidimutans]